MNSQDHATIMKSNPFRSNVSLPLTPEKYILLLLLRVSGWIHLRVDFLLLYYMPVSALDDESAEKAHLLVP